MRRITSLLLAAVILVSAVFAGGFQVSAESELHASDECIAMLKEYEGFSSKPYWDYGQYTVGYGTKCPDDMYSHYSQYGITEEEADTLLRNYVAYYERDLYAFAEKYNRDFTQNEFDALVLFSYNCGSGWTTKTSSEFHQSVAKGATGNEMIYWFSRWCTVNNGATILNSLLKRRLSEANLYLNGVYSTSVPENYCYVFYNTNGGSMDGRVQGFDANLSVDFAATPTYYGHKFLGWYTADGTQVTSLSASLNGETLYARWDTDSSATGTQQTTDPVKVTVTDTNVNLRKGPGTNYTIVGQAQKGATYTITAIASANGYDWGKFDGGWIALRYTNFATAKQEQEQESEEGQIEETQPDISGTESTEPEVTEPETTEPETTKVTGKVKANGGLNIRSGAGTGYASVGTYANGTSVTILEQKTVGSMIWGKTDKGWISMTYVTLDSMQSGTSGSTSNNTQSTAVTGTITTNDLRIRSGAGTSYSIVGYLNTGNKVTITEQKTVGSMTWGKISQGWISMNYVKLDSDSTSSGTGNDTSSGSNNTTTTQTQSGTVKADGYLRIRSGAGTSYAVAGYLYSGDKVEITETKTVGSTTWGKISKGWISLDYVVLSSQTSSGTTTEKVTKTVNTDCLRIRSSAGTSSSIVGYLYYGAKVEITETTTVGSTTWGKTSQGWISMDYVK